MRRSIFTEDLYYVTPFNILLAEDDPDDQQFFREALQQLSLSTHQLTSVYSGREAIEYLQSNLPDLIVLDLNMPMIDGYQVLKTLSATDSLRKIPAFVLTTSSEWRDTVRCRELGCREFYTKPLTISELKDIINDMLTKARLHS